MPPPAGMAELNKGVLDDYETVLVIASTAFENRSPTTSDLFHFVTRISDRIDNLVEKHQVWGKQGESFPADRKQAFVVDLLEQALAIAKQEIEL